MWCLLLGSAVAAAALWAALVLDPIRPLLMLCFLWYCRYATPMSEIDFAQCRKCTPSYRSLPKHYPKPVCSERSEVEASMLNDEWVSAPLPHLRPL